MSSPTSAETSVMPPLIDLRLFETSPGECAQQMHDACRDVGFFYVKSPLVTQALIDSVFAAARDLFDLPEESKESAAAKNSPLFRGYQGASSESHSCTPSGNQGVKERDLKESFALGAVGQSSPMHGPNQWPEDYSEERRRQIMHYWDVMHRVSLEVSECLALSLGLDSDFFTRLMADPVAQMVLFRYPPDRGDHRIGCGAHTDCGFLTLLVQQGEKIDSLQVRKKGTKDTWLDAPQLEGAILCNLGDMAARFTNDWFVSTWHRVNPVKSNQARFSIPFFTNLDFEARVDPSDIRKGPLGEKVGEVKYPSVKAGDYICEALGLMYGKEASAPVNGL